MIPIRSAAKSRFLERVEQEEAERTPVDANRELIVRVEKKIQTKLAEIGGKPPEVSA